MSFDKGSLRVEFFAAELHLGRLLSEFPSVLLWSNCSGYNYLFYRGWSVPQFIRVYIPEISRVPHSGWMTRPDFTILLPFFSYFTWDIFPHHTVTLVHFSSFHDDFLCLILAKSHCPMFEMWRDTHNVLICALLIQDISRLYHPNHHFIYFMDFFRGNNTRSCRV